MMQFDNSERAKRFNSLPHEERKQIVARIDAIRASNRPTQADEQFIRDPIGFGHELGRQTLLLYPPGTGR